MCIMCLYMKVDHYLRWLNQSFNLINQNPDSYIVSTIYEQPLESSLRAEVKALLSKRHPMKEPISAANNPNTWLRFRRLGGREKFDYFLHSIMRGHAESVTSLYVSSDGKLLVSRSEKDRTAKVHHINP